MQVALDFFPWIIDLLQTALLSLWSQLVDLQSRYPQLLSMQTVFGLVGSVLGVWKWWESREANLFRRFERMIEGYEAQLVTARSTLLEVMNRPGPGLMIRAPLFIESGLKLVLVRRKWTPASLLPLPAKVDRRLESAIRTCNRKVSAHIDRLRFFREQLASARLIQGALAAGRATQMRKEHERQRLDQEALDHFRAVLAIPGHKEDLAALELIAHQLARLDGQGRAAENAYLAIMDALVEQQESPRRNLLLARAKRCLAILSYPDTPVIAKDWLMEASDLLTQFGPPQDRDFLELAETLYLEGVARLRLGNNVRAPQVLSQAQGHYRGLLRSLHSRRHGLFTWMSKERKYSGHRVAELRARAEQGLAQVDHLINLSTKHQALLIASLARGSGVPRRNRKPSR